MIPTQQVRGPLLHWHAVHCLLKADCMVQPLLVGVGSGIALLELQGRGMGGGMGKGERGQGGVLLP